MSLDLHVLDVFAEARLAGNPLAVIRHREALDTATMQAIALETNLSETTFLSGERNADGSFPVRIFTPTQELPFAGHPTLGSAWFLRHRVLHAIEETIVLDLKIGRVPVSFEAEGEDAVGFFRGPRAEIGESLPRAELAPVLGLEPEDLDADSKPHRVVAGLEFLVVPLRTAAALAAVRIDASAFRPLAARGLNPFFYVFSPTAEDSPNDLAARFFFEANGFREDPATGSATNALGHYLLHRRYFGADAIDLRVEQGVQMGRPSLLRVRGSLGSDGSTVEVGGRVFETLRGQLLLP